MTKKLYYEDSYLKEGKAKIIDIIEEAGAIQVVLDQTLFYPEGGGQPADRGSINGIKVLDVQEKNGLIYHRLEEKPQGEEALMTLDWERRFDLMQQHSGEHILSGIFHKLFGAANKGFHLGDQMVTIDIDMKNISKDQLDQVEALANQAIYEGKEVQQAITDQAGLAAYGPRKLIQPGEDIRVVTIAETDVCPCCGTHVKNAAEIGIIKILKADAHKGMTRISFLSGARAYRDYKKRTEIIGDLKQILNSDEDNLVQRLEKVTKEMQDIKYKLREQQNLLAQVEFEKTLGQGQDKEVYHRFQDLDGDQIDHIVKTQKEAYKTLVLASEKDRKLIAYSKDLDMGKIFKDKLKDYQGRGGGRGPLAQASFEKLTDLVAFMEYIKEEEDKA